MAAFPQARRIAAFFVAGAVLAYTFLY